MRQVEIIAVGDELLLGDVLDTNSHWLCRQFTGLGGRVRRIVQVRDDPEAIARNWRGLDGLGSAETAATLKADAYGLGAALAAPALFDAGCRRFFVAEPVELAGLVAALGARDGAVSYVYNGAAANLPAILEAGARPVLNSGADVAAAIAVATGQANVGLLRGP